jgi:hypothetical protein
MSTLKKILTISALLLLTVLFVIRSLEHPSLTRNWNLDQQVLPEVTTNSNLVSVKNVRNFAYASTSAYDVRYYDKGYNLDDLKGLWFVVEPFEGGVDAAHTFLSFEFENDIFLSASIEIRKEVGESFSPVQGILNKYELMYVLADEEDVIDLRANHRKDEVYLYKVKVEDEEKLKELFLSMMARTQKLSSTPEFYNTLTNNCTTNIVDHINMLGNHPIPFTLATIFPANADRVAYELGLLETRNMSFEELKKFSHINKAAEVCRGNANFGKCVREVGGL